MNTQLEKTTALLFNSPQELTQLERWAANNQPDARPFSSQETGKLVLAIEDNKIDKVVLVSVVSLLATQSFHMVFRVAIQAEVPLITTSAKVLRPASALCDQQSQLHRAVYQSRT